MKDPMGLQATTSNGHTLLIDFIDYANAEERDAIVEGWNSYYKKAFSGNIGQVTSFSFCMFDKKKFDACNNQAQDRFNKSFKSLGQEEKLSITREVDSVNSCCIF